MAGGGRRPASKSSPVCTESLYVYNGTPYVAYESDGATVMEYAGATTASSAEPAIQVNINGSPLQMDVPPTIVNGRTMAPLRAIFEAPGGHGAVECCRPEHRRHQGQYYNQASDRHTTALNNGVQVTLDVAPQIVNGRTLVPAQVCQRGPGGTGQLGRYHSAGEHPHREPLNLKSRSEAKIANFEYIKVFYNRFRLHSTSWI